MEELTYYGKAIGFRDAIIALMEILITENITIPEIVMEKLDEKKNELYPAEKSNNNSFYDEIDGINEDLNFNPFMGSYEY